MRRNRGEGGGWKTDLFGGCFNSLRMAYSTFPPPVVASTVTYTKKTVMLN